MKKTVAIVDDEEVFHWITRKFLEKISGEIEVVSYYNGQEAIDGLLSSDNFPDVLLLDLNMPIANGWHFLDSFPDLQTEGVDKMHIFVVSSSIDPEDMKKAESYEYVNDFISKPLTLDLLQEMLEL